WFSDDVGQFKFAELQTSDALLLGRKTYEGFAKAWPAMREETGVFGVKMNDMPKYVVSATLREASWGIGSRAVGLDDVPALKEQPGQDLLLAGSGQLFNALVRANLVDTYRFLVHPVVLGRGAKLFADGAEQLPLRLVSSTTFSSGALVLEYARRS